MGKITNTRHESESKLWRDMSIDERQEFCRGLGFEYEPKINKEPGRAPTWTGEEIETVKELNSQGYVYEDIAAKLGRSYRTIMRLMQRNGIPYNGSRGQRATARASRAHLEQHYDKILADFYAGFSYDDISQKYGHTRSVIETYLRKRGYRLSHKRLSDDDKDVINRYYGNGCTVSCIAHRLNRGHECINYYIKTEELEVDEMFPDNGTILDLHKGGMLPEQIAAKLELPLETVKHNIAARPIQRGRHKYFSPEEDRKILTWRVDGYSIVAIAKSTGRTYNSIRSRLRRILED